MKKVLCVCLFLLLYSAAFGKDYNVDVAIVGGGWSGLVAGVAAGDAGLTAVILEKMPTAGGSGVYVGGTAATGFFPEQLTTDRGFTRYQEFTHHVPDSRVMRALFKELGNNITWLQEHGVSFSMSIEGRVYGFREGLGANVVKNFNDRINKMDNVTLLTETKANRLIVENGQVKGVIGDNDGETIRVNAKYTILATGGIVDNPEMMKKYVPTLGDNYRVIGSKGRTGDGITLAQQAGAKIDPIIGVDTEAGHTMNHSEIAIHVLDPEMEPLHAVIKLPFIRVNQRGERFMPETINQFHMERHAIERNNNVYYTIIDEEIKNDLINKGIDDMGLYRAGEPAITRSKLPGLATGLEKAYAKEYAFKADTIQDLAKLIKVDPKILQATIDRQNTFAKNGRDEDFLKDPKYLHNYVKGPFYAVKAEHTLLGTVGGVQCTDTFQVIREDLSPIPGLYVTGTLIGAQVGDTYPMLVQGGTSSGFGVAASRVIIANIAKELKK
jgi:fumarate reductase flavoprotein subunit